MEFSYGGSTTDPVGSPGITIDVVKTVQFDKQPIFSDDGVDYLWTKFTIEIEGYINPAATAYDLEGGIPVVSKGTLPTITEVSIRHILAQPRKVLFCDVLNNSLLVSPNIRGDGKHYFKDALNGPHPQIQKIKRIDGEKTFWISYKIVTHINECPSTLQGVGPPGTGNPLNVIRPSALVSNRFSQRQEVNDQQMLTVITTGRARFRTDALERDEFGEAILSPDFYRRVLIANCPLGFRRVDVKINQASDNSTYDYVITDVEQFYSLGNTFGPGGSGVVRFEGYYEVSSYTPPQGTANVPIASLMTVQTCKIIAYGALVSNKWKMTKFCLAIIKDKLELHRGDLGEVNPANPTQTLPLKCRILSHLHEKQVEVEYQVLKPCTHIESRTINVLGIPVPIDPPRNIINLNQMRNWPEYLIVNDPDGLAAALGANNPGTGTRAGENNSVVVFGASGRTPPFINDNQTRGSSRLRILSANVQDACQPENAVTISSYNLQFQTPIQVSNSPSIDVQIVADIDEYQEEFDTKLTEEQMGDNFLTNYRVDTWFETDEHILQAPVAAFNSPSQKVQTEYLVVSAPTTTRIVKWTGERVGQMPQIPNPQIVNDPNWVLLDRQIIPSSPVVMIDGDTLVYRVSGVYTFGAITYLDTQNSLPVSVMPWLNLTYSEQQVQPTDYVRGIIEPGDTQFYNPIQGNSN